MRTDPLCRRTPGICCGILVAVGVLTLGVAACGGGGSRNASADQNETAGAPVPGPRFADFDPANFDAGSTTIDNRYFPLKPGRQYTYRGTTVESGKTVPHSVVFTVTNLVKRIDGVGTTVIWDRDYTDDALEESELTFFAQDKRGTVWHLGQYREEYDGETLLGTQAWMVGHLEGARAGIFMPPDPQAGTPSFSEGYAPAPFFWTDRSQIERAGTTVEVPAGTYHDVVVAAEYSDTEPGAFQLKYYAPDVGVVQVGYRGNDSSKEQLELVDIKDLSAAELAALGAEALQLETRAYVYGTTPAAQPRPAAS